MNIIIVGDGKVGAALATQLSSEGHDVTIIDSNPQALSESAERLDVMAVTGNGASMATLREAGVFQQLEDLGIQDGDTVSLDGFEFEYQK